MPLLLAQDAPAGVDPRGFLVSEKYDGVRGLWDGRSLRFRSGLPIEAPTWFTARLPAQALDGELWLGRGRFEELSGIVRRHQPADEAWRQLHFMVFELPGARGSFAERAQRISDLTKDAAWPALKAVVQTSVGSAADLRQRLDDVVCAGG
jgi:DNA ligase-1